MKKTVSLLHLQKLLVDYFNTYLVIAILSYVLTVLTQDPMMILKVHLLLILPIYTYFIRQKIWNLFLFIALHAASFLILFFYNIENDIIVNLSIAVGIFIFIVYSFALRLHQAKHEITIGGVIVLCGAFAIGYFCTEIPQIAAGEEIRIYLMTASLIVLLVYFIDLHFKNIDSTLNNVNEMLNQPAQKIRKFNQKILLYFIAGTGIFIFLALIFRLDRGIVALGQGLLWLIRYLVSLIPKGEAVSEESVFQEESIPESSQEDVEFEPVGPNPFWEFLEFVMTIAVVIALIALTIYALYRFYKWFYSRKPETISFDEFEETSIFMEAKEKASKKRDFFWSRFRLTNEKKIRRIYKKRLEIPMRKQEIIKVSDSPKEILEKMPSEGLENLTELYEKARYSNQPITKEEVKRAESTS